MFIHKDEIRNYLQEGRPIEELVKLASQVIEEGGEVHIQEERHQGTVTVQTLEDQDDLEQWENQFYLDPDTYYLCQGESVITAVDDFQRQGGRRNVIIKPTMGGRVVSRGQREPVKISFSVNRFIDPNGNYYIFKDDEGTIQFFIERRHFKNGRTYIEGVEIG